MSSGTGAAINKKKLEPVSEELITKTATKDVKTRTQKMMTEALALMSLDHLLREATFSLVKEPTEEDSGAFNKDSKDFE